MVTPTSYFDYVINEQPLNVGHQFSTILSPYPRRANVQLIFLNIYSAGFFYRNSFSKKGGGIHFNFASEHVTILDLLGL